MRSRSSYLAAGVGICLVIAVANCGSMRSGLGDVAQEPSYSPATINDVLAKLGELSAFPAEPSAIVIRLAGDNAKLGIFVPATAGYQVTVWLCPDVRGLSGPLLAAGRQRGWEAHATNDELACRFRVTFYQQGTTAEVRELIEYILHDVLAAAIVGMYAQ